MSNLRGQDTCPTYVSERNGITMAFFDVGHGCDWTHNPKASNGHRFIFVVIDYFTKWVEAASYASVTKAVVARFIKKEIICRYGLPERIISDNGLNLNNNTVTEVCTTFKIKHHNSVPYRRKMNGAVKAANKNVKKIIAKATETYKD